MKNKVWLLTILVIFSFTVVGCGKEVKEVKEEKLLGINYEIEENETNLSKYDTKNPVVAMYVEGYGSIVMELYPEIAPNTVYNFISLTKAGFYDNNSFHRLVSGFVLQGGDPDGTGMGGPGYSIKGEFTENGFDNELKHTQGVLSMARSQDYDSAGSQFFIMLEDNDSLDGSYAAFGKVIDGFDIITDVAKNETITDPNSGKLTKNLVIKKAVIDLKGKEYPEVEKITE